MTQIIEQNLQENYFGIENDIAFLSEINNLNIESATKLSFDYITPPDGVNGQVVIWNSFYADTTKSPIYQADLPKAISSFEVNPKDINFNKGVYTIAVTAGPGLNTVGATQTILNGQPVQSGSSSLFVIAKNLKSINLTFNSPANVIASQNITWVIIYEGNTLGQGTRVAQQTSSPGSSSGLITVNFTAGTLENGKIYNAVLNPGNTTRTATAGYVFKYVLQ